MCYSFLLVNYMCGFLDKGGTAFKCTVFLARNQTKQRGDDIIESCTSNDFG